MSAEIQILAVTAASIGFIHTLFGPDHYIPFIMLAKAGKWSNTKTIVITILSGLGHVLSSVVIGLIGIALGIAVHKLKLLESFRGNLAGWMLITFGLLYFIWGLRQSFRNKIHSHNHIHEDGSKHIHDHNHHKEHMHPHEGKNKLTYWTIFAIFIFGPCEPLIPILMYPAAKSSLLGMALVTLIFGVVTISTMLALVLLSIKGIEFIPLKKIERYMHAISGAAIFLCGISIQFLGL